MMLLIHFFVNFDYNSLSFLEFEIEEVERIAHVIADRFKLNPWEVLKWNFEKMSKTYKFIANNKF